MAFGAADVRDNAIATEGMAAWKEYSLLSGAKVVDVDSYDRSSRLMDHSVARSIGAILSKLNVANHAGIRRDLDEARAKSSTDKMSHCFNWSAIRVEHLLLVARLR